MNLDDLKVLIELNKIDETIEVLKNAWKGPMNIYEQQIILFSGRWAKHKQENSSGLTLTETINDIKNDILTFATEVSRQKVDNDTIEQLLKSSLVVKNSYPFVDRKNFREKFNDILTSDEAQLFLVDGEPKSGMSHIEKFLKHLNDDLKIFNFIPLEIPTILDEADTILGEELAKYISYEMGIEVNFENEPKSQFKFIQFINKLKTKIKTDDKVPLFFLHDFHKLEDGTNDNLLELIYMLITAINNNFPRSVFILAGLKYSSLKNWHSDLRLIVSIYKMESASAEDISPCLGCIYDEYKVKIEEMFEEMYHRPITREEYIEVMLEDLVENDQSVIIDKVGDKLKDHLFALKN